MDIRLEDITDDFTKEQVFNWDYIPVDGLCRIYYKIDFSVSGFSFYILESIGSEEYRGNLDDWSPKHSFVEILWHGNTFFDGIRHLYQGSELTDNYGYLYYPDVPRIIKIFGNLHDLQKKYCEEWLDYNEYNEEIKRTL